jgi:hypothetical protein
VAEDLDLPSVLLEAGKRLCVARLPVEIEERHGPRGEGAAQAEDVLHELRGVERAEARRVGEGLEAADAGELERAGLAEPGAEAVRDEGGGGVDRADLLRELLPGAAREGRAHLRDRHSREEVVLEGRDVAPRVEGHVGAQASIGLRQGASRSRAEAALRRAVATHGTSSFAGVATVADAFNRTAPGEPPR